MAPAEGAEIILDALTFYVCRGAPPGFQDGYCGLGADGTQVYEGMAACGYAFPLGTTFKVIGDDSQRTYTCHDRGLGPAYWIDVFFWEYADGRAFSDSIPRPARVRVTAPNGS